MIKYAMLLTAVLGMILTGSGCTSSDAEQYEFMRPDYRSGSKSMTESKRQREEKSAKKVEPKPSTVEKDADEEKASKSWSLFSKKNREEDPDKAEAKKKDNIPDELQRSHSSGMPYKLAVGDSVGILLSGIPVEQEISDIIDDKGFIKLAYIGKIQAVGLTPSQLEEIIEQTYIEQKIYKQITANVLMQAKSYFVRGEVRSPGRFGLPNEGVSLVQAVATAGGFNEFANHKKIQIIRGLKTFRVNLEEMEENPSLDIPMEAGDTIVVERKFL